MTLLHLQDGPGTSTPKVEAMLAELERQMPDLQVRNPNVFALANAWAERHDAILAVTPAADRPTIEMRLRRIGIRWAVMPGPRVTQEFHALSSLADAPAELRRKG
jgi:hypothetical protein